MTEVSITTKPPLCEAVIEFWQDEKLIHEDVLTAGGSYAADLSFESGAVRVKIGDTIETNQNQRDLKGLRFLTTSKKPLSQEEAMRRWKRVSAGLPPDWLDKKLSAEVLAKRQNDIGREAFKD